MGLRGFHSPQLLCNSFILDIEREFILSRAIRAWLRLHTDTEHSLRAPVGRFAGWFLTAALGSKLAAVGSIELAH